MVPPSAKNGGPRNKVQSAISQACKEWSYSNIQWKISIIKVDNQREPNKERMLTLEDGEVHDWGPNSRILHQRIG